MSDTNRQWLLAKRPVGVVKESYTGANFGKQLLEL